MRPGSADLIFALGVRAWATALVLGVALLTGCPPTLSRPHSEVFVNELATGERHAGHGRDAEAAAAFGRAAEAADRRVDQDEARYRRARALEDEGQWEQALALLDQIAERQPPSRRTARALLDASETRLEHDYETSRAQRDLERIVLEFSDQGPASRALVRLIEIRRMGPEALDALYAQVAQTLLADDVLVHIADHYADAEDPAGERAALERVVRDHPYPQGHRWDDATLRLVEMDVAAGRPRDAIARLESMLERAEGTSLIGSYTLPAFPRARLRVAQLQRELGERDLAHANFLKVEEDFPDSRLRDDARLEAGEMWLEVADEERACAMFASITEDFEVGSARRRAEAHLARCP